MRPEHCLATRWPRLRAAAERERRAAPGKHVPASVFLTSCIHLATVLVVYTVRLTEEFVAWLDALSDKRAQVRIAARLRQAEAGNLGDWQPIEGDVSEMRVHYGPGYRLYFVRRGRVIVVILNAGDKSTQKRDVRRAARLAAELGEDQ